MSRPVPPWCSWTVSPLARRAAVCVARAGRAAAGRKVQQTRALRGLKPDREHPEVVPENIDRSFAGVQYVRSSGQQTLAQLGVPINLFGMTPSELEKNLHE